MGNASSNPPSGLAKTELPDMKAGAGSFLEATLILAFSLGLAYLLAWAGIGIGRWFKMDDVAGAALLMGPVLFFYTRWMRVMKAKLTVSLALLKVLSQYVESQQKKAAPGAPKAAPGTAKENQESR